MLSFTPQLAKQITWKVDHNVFLIDALTVT